MTATHNHPVDPVISYTEAARDITSMQLYLMIWIEAILKLIIIIDVLIVSQVLSGRQDHMRFEYVFDEEEEECQGVPSPRYALPIRGGRQRHRGLQT